jgi:hypothetical protein
VSARVGEYFPSCNDNIATNEFTCGVEWEIEDIKDFSDVTGVVIETDDSLRNNGREFKSPPSNFDKTIKTFDNLFASLKLGKEPFSERTSTHVHVNVSHLSLNAARQLVLTYALLEPVLFAFVGKARQDNIYCVPLNYTYLPSTYKLAFDGLHGKWHKYTAFNILPASTLGTVEFRHLYGTKDKAVFNLWLTTLKELYEFIRDNEDFNIVDALKDFPREFLARKIIPSMASLYTNSELNKMMEDTQLDVKLSAGGLK